MTSPRPTALRTTRTIAVAVGSLPAAFLLGAMIVGVVTLPGETTLVGRRGGPWTSVATWKVQTGALAILLPLTGVILWRLAWALVSSSGAVVSLEQQRRQKDWPRRAGHVAGAARMAWLHGRSFDADEFRRARTSLVPPMDVGPADSVDPLTWKLSGLLVR